MLREPTRRRLHAKAMSRHTGGAERAMWEGLQSSFKVLINSFYGYLGFGGGLFNDYEAAERVTLAGQELIKATVGYLRETGARPIEVDTDGVYFVPPPGIENEEDELRYIDAIGAKLPDGIRLAHDGRYRAMLSLRLKNYALLNDDGTMVMKGSALRSRRLEPCFRAFLADAARGFVMEDRAGVRERYFALGERIRNRAMEPPEISQWAMVHDDTLRTQTRLKRLVERLPQRVRGGERVQIYEREDGELATIEEYAGDENVSYLLRRLHDTANRFRDLFAGNAEFTAFFPPLSVRTDLASARTQAVSTQLGLF
jgi:hypothetical protein